MPIIDASCLYRLFEIRLMYFFDNFCLFPAFICNFLQFPVQSLGQSTKIVWDSHFSPALIMGCGK